MQSKNSILKFEIISTIFIMILGTLLHFTFEWSNHNTFIGTFSAINESTWEHLKLLFFPTLLTTIIGSFYFKKNIPNYLCIKTQGILLSLSFIIIFFYTYSGILGTHFSLLDIGSFFVAIILGQYYTYQKIKNSASCNSLKASIILLILFLCFELFTFFPPHIGLFEDPTTSTYGIFNSHN